MRYCAPEIQPLKGRDFGITCSTATNWIANMIRRRHLPDHMLNSCWQRQYLLGVRRSERCCLSRRTLWLIPETKNVSLEHIERNLMQGRPLREIGARD
ncbi:sugar porter family MFS transporter [Klebsiella pneumoniae subsp. pneumoniae]|nr:sugar porter family MFS transporter [Klebsiella pneumoniae subsp. pneumoniae]